MSTSTSTSNAPTSTARTERLWPTAVVAGLVAAAGTTALAAIGHAAGASLEVGGEEIVLPAFAELTFVFSMVGLLIALGLRRWASNPRQAWVRTTVALTALSLVPDVLADASVATRVTLMATHVLAAAIVIPAVASRLDRP